MRSSAKMRPLSAALLALFLAACGGSDGEVITATPPAPPPDTSCAVNSSTGSVVVGSGLAGDPAAPEPASGYRTGLTAVHAKTYMVVTNTPLASKAGCDILKAGGSAVDAAIAVQMVLGLVEPQSSGLGGGAFMLHYDAKTRTVTSYDGRETAPATATENHLRWIDDNTNRTTPLPSARASGRSIGTPGVLKMLELAHREQGKLPWKDLFQPGIKLASEGFKIPGRMADAIAANRANLVRDAEATATYYNADGSPKALGSTLTIPAYAATLTAIANNGVAAFYGGDIAQSIVNKINITASADGASPITPGKTTLSDLSSYVAKKRPAVCTTYRSYWVCGMGPPSSGGITVAQSLGILENFSLDLFPPTALDKEGGKPDVFGVHLISEAERLAYADRDKYIADTDFISLPGGTWNTMLNKPYLRSRADLISFSRSMGTAQPGDLGAVPLGVVPTPENGTTQVTIVDKTGNVVTFTTTVESSFGSFHMTRGFMLNNQLTDFAATPTDAAGVAVANRVQALKRPRSSMAPTLVFRKAADGAMGDFAMATGSPGGATIIQYVVKTLVGVLDWKMDAQQATAMVDFGAANSTTTSVGGENPSINATNNGGSDPLVTGLRALGHTVNVGAQSSGIATIVRTQVKGENVWQGGVDPRREGLALGDTFVP